MNFFRNNNHLVLYFFASFVISIILVFILIGYKPDYPSLTNDTTNNSESNSFYSSQNLADMGECVFGGENLWCFNYAHNFGTGSNCGGSKEECYNLRAAEVALSNSDVDLCFVITDKTIKDACVANLAFALSKKELCEKITNIFNRDQCYSVFS